jgi:5-methylcytosine-specific restriction endonuclease McrA
MARTRNQGSKWIRPAKRLAIYNRDGFCCAYCGAKAEEGIMLTLDHVVACELGGSNHETNLVTACLSCNSSKQDSTTRGWFEILRDRGIDTSKVGPRIRRLTAKPLDMEAGKALLAARKGE